MHFIHLFSVSLPFIFIVNIPFYLSDTEFMNNERKKFHISAMTSQLYEKVLATSCRYYSINISMLWSVGVCLYVLLISPAAKQTDINTLLHLSRRLSVIINSCSKTRPLNIHKYATVSSNTIRASFRKYHIHHFAASLVFCRSFIEKHEVTRQPAFAITLCKSLSVLLKV